MRKTLLLCFIHGFKVRHHSGRAIRIWQLTRTQGGESTFGRDYAFVEHLRKLVAGALPKVDVQAVVYPKYETRGDLGECVTKFSDW
jgi:hypothetical protein